MSLYISPYLATFNRKRLRTEYAENAYGFKVREVETIDAKLRCHMANRIRDMFSQGPHFCYGWEIPEDLSIMYKK